eukprot:Hpha_TRINITY_DN15133_c6_g2::TRINITY_DN15133_c6_g2_i1::g.126990::m.126990/K08802/SNRK; SNF related kinase
MGDNSAENTTSAGAPASAVLPAAETETNATANSTAQPSPPSPQAPAPGGCGCKRAGAGHVCNSICTHIGCDGSCPGAKDGSSAAGQNRLGRGARAPRARDTQLHRRAGALPLPRPDGAPSLLVPRPQQASPPPPQQPQAQNQTQAQPQPQPQQQPPPQQQQSQPQQQQPQSQQQQSQPQPQQQPPPQQHQQPQQQLPQQQLFQQQLQPQQPRAQPPHQVLQVQPRHPGQQLQPQLAPGMRQMPGQPAAARPQQPMPAQCGMCGTPSIQSPLDLSSGGGWYCHKCWMGYWSGGGLCVSVTTNIQPPHCQMPNCSFVGPLTESNGGGWYCGNCWRGYKGHCRPLGPQIAGRGPPTQPGQEPPHRGQPAVQAPAPPPQQQQQPQPQQPPQPQVPQPPPPQQPPTPSSAQGDKGSEGGQGTPISKSASQLDPEARAWTPSSSGPPGGASFGGRTGSTAGQQAWQRRDAPPGAAPQGTPQSAVQPPARHFPTSGADALTRPQSLPATPLPSMEAEKLEDPTQNAGTAKYTKQEFLEFYGHEKGERYWAKARAGEKYPTKPSPQALLDCAVRQNRNGSRTVANRYELTQTVLGQGAFAVVYHAKDIQTGDDVAIKVIQKQPTSLEVELEVALLKSCQHENVVRLLNAYASQREYFLVLEAVKGGDLGQLINTRNKNRLDEAEARLHFRGIVHGLQALHAAGICHRDLKPENCLVTTDSPPVIKLTDLGISSWHREPDQLCRDKGVGTVYYCAPEVLVGDYDAFAADVWSAGAVLFVMLTGRYAVGTVNKREEEVEELLRQNKLNKIPEFVSSAARDLIRNLLIPKDRLKLEQVMIHPWVRWNEKDRMDSKGDQLVGAGGSRADSDSEELAAFAPRGGRGAVQPRRGRRTQNLRSFQDGGRHGGRGGLSSQVSHGRTKS